MAKSECQSESENRIQIYRDELNERSELNQSESTRDSHSHSDLVPGAGIEPARPLLATGF